jgi:hypothetical protein
MENNIEMVTLRCAACGLPFARLQNGVVVVQSKHHGQKHVNGVAVARLVELCQEGGAPDGEGGLASQDHEE